MEIGRDALQAARGRDVLDLHGERIGSLEGVHPAGARRPAWVGVGMGLFGLRHRAVPVGGAQLDNAGLHVAVSHDAVDASPAVGDAITAEQETALVDHYGPATNGARASGTEEPAADEDNDSSVGPGSGDVGLRPPEIDLDEARERQTGEAPAESERERPQGWVQVLTVADPSWRRGGAGPATPRR